MVMLLLLVSVLLVCFLIVSSYLGCYSYGSAWMDGLSLGFRIPVFSAGGGRGSVEAWYTSALDIEEVLSGAY